MVKRAPTILEYLHAPPGTYPAFERTYRDRPAIDVQSPRVRQNLDTLMGPVPHMVPRGVGPVAVTTGDRPQGLDSIMRGLAGLDGPITPHSTLSEVAMLPMATAEQQDRAAPLPPPAPFGLPAGGVNDAKVAPPDAAGGVMNGMDSWNAQNPLRAPVQTQAPPSGMMQPGLADWLVRLLTTGQQR